MTTRWAHGAHAMCASCMRHVDALPFGMANKAKLQRHTVLKIAAESEADPRTVESVINGRTIRGAVDGRVRRVLQAHGIIPTVSPLAIDSTPKSVA
jgi:hypothetical protein